MSEVLAALGLGFVWSLVATALVRALARKANLVAKPRADRWHKRPTALFGGIGIYAGFVATYLIIRPAPAPGQILLLVCATGMFLVGVVDDLFQLKPYAKLVAQLTLATGFTMFGLRLHWIPSPVFDQALTVFWLVGVTNALNLLDNLDGLAGGVAAIASAYLIYFALESGQPSAAALAAAFTGAVAGFLVFNFHPASIFMGDCGSLFLGFFLGGISLVNTQPGMRRNVVTILTIPVLLLLIPIVDTTLVTISRKMHGRPVSQGGRDHTSHRLVALGMSERTAALVLWIAAALSGGLAVLVHNLSWAVAIVLVPAFGVIVLFFFIYIGRVQVYAPVTDGSVTPSTTLLPTLADFSYKRRVFEVLHDLIVIVLCYYGAFLLRFDGELIKPYYSHFLWTLPVVMALQLSAFLAFGLYRGLWRYTSLSDLGAVIRAVAGGWIISIVVIVFLMRPKVYSRGVFIIDALLLGVALLGSRLSFRLIRQWLGRLRPSAGGRRTLIYGAGDGGELLLREIHNNQQLGLLPVGFLDDDPSKLGREIHGIRVLGALDRLPQVATQLRAQQLIISTSKLDEEHSGLASTLCQEAGISCRRMRIVIE